MLTDASHEAITYTTPVFTVEPTSGVELALFAGTYLFYNQIYGGRNKFTTANANASGHVTFYPGATAPGRARSLLQDSGAQPTYVVAVESLQDVEPSRTEGWRYLY